MKALAKYVLIFFSFSVMAEKRKEINLIESFTIEKNHLDVKINHKFKEKYLTEDFFVTYDNDIDLSKMDPSIALMPFLLNVLTIIWISGEEYWVDAMDATFYKAAKEIKRVFKKIYPATPWNGRLIPRQLIQNKHLMLKDPDKEIALLFQRRTRFSMLIALSSTQKAASYNGLWSV